MQFKIIVFLSPDIWNFGLFKARIPAFLCNLYSFQSNVINIQSKQLGTEQGFYKERKKKKMTKDDVVLGSRIFISCFIQRRKQIIHYPLFPSLSLSLFPSLSLSLSVYVEISLWVGFAKGWITFCFQPKSAVLQQQSTPLIKKKPNRNPL